MKKKIVLIVLSIAIIALILGVYSLWMKRASFKPTQTYSICIWGDTSATATIRYIAKNGDSNTIMQQQNMPMIRKKSEHSLQKWNMILIKPSYLTNDKNIPFEVEISTQNKDKVYVAIFDNDTMPRWSNDSFLVFHLLMLRSAYDNNPDVAAKSVEEWMEKSSFFKGKNDTTKNLIAQTLWQKVQTIDRDSIAHYLQAINYPLFKVIDPNEGSFLILKK